MKKFYLILFLFFSLKVFAESIKDYNLENFDIGSKITDYFSIPFIKKNELKGYFDTFDNPDLFAVIAIRDEKYLNDFEHVEIYYKKSDSIIHSVVAGSFYSDIDKCYKDMDDYSNLLKSIFPYSQKIGPNTNSHYADPEQKSTYTHIDFVTVDGTVGVHCYNWSQNMTLKNNWRDNIQIAIRSMEINNYIGYY
tara:strand:- start:958 stop:1536 length:579 start_codon:yes stop_codon:yes gene_type:complete